jgi:transposase
MQYGRRSERLDPDQMQLVLEDTEMAVAERAAQMEKTAAPDLAADHQQKKQRHTNRGALPAHLPRIHITVYTVCPCCRGPLHVIGEDVAERLDVVPAQYRVIGTHRPKYGCRACEGAVVQAPAPERLIKNGIPTEALVAAVVTDKYAWHKPLHRAQIMALQGLPVDRATPAGWALGRPNSSRFICG